LLLLKPPLLFVVFECEPPSANGVLQERKEHVPVWATSTSIFLRSDDKGELFGGAVPASSSPSVRDDSLVGMAAGFESLSSSTPFMF
jgi:hypothetical protein